MLILDCNKKQTFYIGDDVAVTVLQVQGDQVCLGIDASGDMVILRQEVYEWPKNDEVDGEQIGTNVSSALCFKGNLPQ